MEFMQNEGYELTNLHEHFFQKDDIGVNFGVIDGSTTNTIPSIEAFADIDPADIPIIQTCGALYKLLTVEQYYKVYSKSLEDNYRNREGDIKDQKKVDILKKLLNVTE